jgi:hypothetical protein
MHCFLRKQCILFALLSTDFIAIGRLKISFQNIPVDKPALLGKKAEIISINVRLPK